MIEDKIREELSGSIEAVYKERVNPSKIVVTRPTEEGRGDFTANVAFKLSKNVEADPKEIAEKLVAYLQSQNVFKKVEAVTGFINFYLDKVYFIEILKEILAEKGEYGKNTLFKGKKVQVEFISANPTGPLTLANGRGGFSGDALANVFTWSGAKVTREYYVNDGGNQVRILGDSILAAAGEREGGEDLYKGEYIEKWAKENVAAVKKLKNDSFALGQVAAKSITEKYIKPSVLDLGIKFDNYFSENNLIMSGDVANAIKYFKEKNLTYEKDGALWFKTTNFNDSEDRVLIKSDGENTYFANDTAYHWEKFAKRKFDKVVNFLGADHHGYVERLQSAVSAMGFPGKLDIEILQMVRLVKNGEEMKMSKRKGTYVTTDDLLKLIGGTKKEASDVARFFFLSRSANTHMDFNLDLAKEHSEKNPVYYVKYAYARINGILEKSPFKDGKVDLSLLTDPAEIELIDQLSQMPSLLQSILYMGDYPVHLLTFYAIDLASKFHSFYDKCRVIDEKNPGLSMARLKLVEATRIVLQSVMVELIGIDAPKHM